jgi:hypothetical protein
MKLIKNKMSMYFATLLVFQVFYRIMAVTMALKLIIEILEYLIRQNEISDPDWRESHRRL